MLSCDPEGHELSQILQHPPPRHRNLSTGRLRVSQSQSSSHGRLDVLAVRRRRSTTSTVMLSRRGLMSFCRLTAGSSPSASPFRSFATSSFFTESHSPSLAMT
eukprot:764052-Hanusia_phi.AAC.1